MEYNLEDMKIKVIVKDKEVLIELSDLSNIFKAYRSNGRPRGIPDLEGHIEAAQSFLRSYGSALCPAVAGNKMLRARGVKEYELAEVIKVAGIVSRKLKGPYRWMWEKDDPSHMYPS